MGTEPSVAGEHPHHPACSGEKEPPRFDFVRDNRLESGSAAGLGLGSVKRC